MGLKNIESGIHLNLNFLRFVKNRENKAGTIDDIFLFTEKVKLVMIDYNVYIFIFPGS